MPATSSPTSTLSDVPEGVSRPRRKSRVSAEHTLNRVRENQRRHRARQRDHVTSLELKLAEAEKQLAQARAEIASLKAERDVESAICRYSHITTSILPLPSVGALNLSECVIKDEESSMIEAENRFELLGSSNCSNSTAAASSELSIGINDGISQSTELEQYTGPPPCCEDTPSISSQGIPADPECSTCKTRPLPDPTESTTLCAQAFVLISQQNFRNLDPDTIRAWLAQGLRRAQRQGEGCRVENGALLRLLDFISGV